MKNNEKNTAMASLTRDPTRPDPRMNPIRVHLWAISCRLIYHSPTPLMLCT